MKYSKRMMMLLLVVIVLSVFLSEFVVKGVQVGNPEWFDMLNSLNTTTSAIPNLNEIQSIVEHNNTEYPSVISGTSYSYYTPNPIVAGESTNMSSYLPQDALKYAITWSSIDPGIAQVDENGLVTGVSAGVTKVIAQYYYEPNFDWEHIFTVQVVSRDPTKLSLSPYSFSLLEGEMKTLELTIQPKDFEKYVEWSSSNPSVATVDNHGLVTAKSPGNASIKVVCGSKEYSCTVKVIQKLSVSNSTGQIKTITLLSNQNGTLEGNETKRFKFALPFEATLRYVNHGNTALIVKVYKSNVAIVNSGVPVTNKNYTMQVANEDNTYQKYEFSITNPESNKKSTYSFSLLWDIPTTNTILLNRENVTLPKDTAAEVIINSQSRESTTDINDYDTNSSVAFFGTIDSYSKKKEENNYIFTDEKIGSSDTILYSYDYYDHKRIITDIAVLHVDVKNPTSVVSCLPKVKGILGQDEVATYRITLPEDGCISIVGNGANAILYDNNHNQVAKITVFKPKLIFEQRDNVSIPNLKAGTYSLELTGRSTGNGEYSFAVTESIFKDTSTTSLSLDKTSASVQLEKSLTLKASFKPAYASDSLKWSSSNPEVASVKDGVVYGKKTGTTVITAQKGSQKATCTVTVVGPPVKSLKLNYTTVNLAGASDGVRLVATYRPYNVTDLVKWSASKPNNVRFITTGKNEEYCRVYLNRRGTVTITAIMGNCSATCKIKATYDGSYSIAWGEKLNLSKLTGASNAKWSVKESSIASVSNKGVVKGKSGGSTIVYRKEAGETYKYLINVKVTPIYLNHAKMHIFVCNQAKFNSEKLKVKKATDDLAFKSSNPSVAVVNANGKVTAKSPGTATITATSHGASATCEVTVNRLVYGTVKGSVSTLSGYRGGYTPEVAATIYAYDLFDETRHYRFVQKNEPTYSIKLPTGAYRLEFTSGNCSDFTQIYVSGNKTTTYNARLD